METSGEAEIMGGYGLNLTKTFEKSRPSDAAPRMRAWMFF
jgi:hypothetical protein